MRLLHLLFLLPSCCLPLACSAPEEAGAVDVGATTEVAVSDGDVSPSDADEVVTAVLSEDADTVVAVPAPEADAAEPTEPDLADIPDPPECPVEDCDDGNECTQDECSGKGCFHLPLSGTSCQDGDSCTAYDTCSNGACHAGPPRECEADPDATCLDLVCNSSSGYCTQVSMCPFDSQCADSACQELCAPKCGNRECGPNGCGASCGQCPAGEDCYDGVCVSCAGDCGESCAGCPEFSNCASSCPDGSKCTIGGACGNPCLTCGRPGCTYFGFETETLSGWNVEGGVELGLKSGWPPAPEGERLLRLRTGGGYGALARARLRLCVERGPVTVNLVWREIVTALPELCGQAPITFRVIAASPTASATLLEVTSDDLCPAAACSGCGQDGFTAVETAEDWFGAGGVWATDWQTAAGTLATAGPTIIAVEVSLEAPEDAPPALVLFDGLRITACAPNCTGRLCGDDGCGGTCGVCGPGSECTEAGACTDPECDPDAPISELDLLEEGTVDPGTNLHFDSGGDAVPGSEVIGRVLRVTGPDGVTFTLADPASFNQLYVYQIGEYRLEQHVWDDQGRRSCEPAVETVLVLPSYAIHVELLWDTPADPNQSDVGANAGTDMDLHFVHDKYAVGSDFDGDGDGVGDPWFNQPYDCFWFNPQPNWGTFDPMANDDPALLRDDTDGLGPEAIKMHVPQNGVSYRVGVNYWSDHGYGSSFATVRIYLYGYLVADLSVELDNLDMWCVATIDWWTKTVTPCPDAIAITPNYQNPYFLPSN